MYIFLKQKDTPIRKNHNGVSGWNKLLGSLFDSHGNGHGHTDHGVVTCADQTHHLYALDPSLTHVGVIKPYKT